LGSNPPGHRQIRSRFPPSSAASLGSGVDLWRHWGVIKRELLPIHELLPSLLASLARSSGDARHFKPAWDRIVGPIISRHSSPLRFQDGALAIEVTNAGWARELSDREPEILARVAAVLGEKAPSKLVFRSRE
jgi:hypothetical protein